MVEVTVNVTLNLVVVSSEGLYRTVRRRHVVTKNITDLFSTLLSVCLSLSSPYTTYPGETPPSGLLCMVEVSKAMAMQCNAIVD